jgi:hypothetical protein
MILSSRKDRAPIRVPVASTEAIAFISLPNALTSSTESDFHFKE